MKPRTTRALASVLAGLCCAVACAAPRPLDPVAQRCGEVAEYLFSDWSELRVVQARPAGGDLAVTVRVEGAVEPSGERGSEYASCAFQADARGERLTALRVVVGGRTLDAKELALVNAELLLRDLGRGPV